MKVKLNSKLLTAEVNTHGAELCSVKNSDGYEFMWGADPSVWGKTGPVLFPICGTVTKNTYIYDGKEYNMGIHGFASNSEFEVEAQAEDEVTLLLCANEKTREAYPFEFEFRVIYKLVGNSVAVTFSAKNAGSAEMYCAMGGHEGFALPGGFRDYKLVFDRKLTTAGYNMSGTEPKPECEELLQNSDTLDLASVPLTNGNLGAVVFPNIEADTVSIVHKSGSLKITEDISQFPHFVFWQYYGGEYLCLEPWSALQDRVKDELTNLPEKPDITRLTLGEEFTKTRTITFEV